MTEVDNQLEKTKEWVEKEAEKLEKKLREGETTPTIKVTTKVDEEKLAEILKEKMEGKDDVEMAKEIFEDAKARLLVKADTLGIQIPEERVKNLKDIEYHVQMLQKLEQAQKQAKREPQPKIASGIPSDSPYFSGERQSKGFGSYEEMVMSLRKTARDTQNPDSENAQAILGELLLKSVKGQRELKREIGYEPQEGSVLDTIAELQGKRKRKRSVHRDSRIKIEKER